MTDYRAAKFGGCDKGAFLCDWPRCMCERQSESEQPCATCNDDPEVCATVPGLRHCEAANRSQEKVQQLDRLINEIIGVRESIYDATGSALLAGESNLINDRRAIYSKLCAANNVLWGVVEELQSLRSARAAIIEECAKVCETAYTTFHGRPTAKGARFAKAIRALASSSEREGKDV